MYINVIIRHVLVPNFTDSEQHFIKLGKILAPYNNIIGIDVLPYHSMGEEKYTQLNINYPLKGTKDVSLKQAKDARSIIVKSYLKNKN